MNDASIRPPERRHHFFEQVLLFSRVAWGEVERLNAVHMGFPCNLSSSGGR
jgi:hypothetical protein